MSAIPLVILIALLLVWAGNGWLAILRTPARNGPEWLGYSLALGFAWLGAVAGVLSLAGSVATPAVLAIGLALPGIAGVRGARAEWRTGWAGFLPCIALVLIALSLATERPVWNVDAMKRWVLHGQWLAHEHSIVPDRMADETWATTHPSYPPVVPATIGLAIGLGADRDTGVRPLFPLFYLALLGIVYGHARRRLCGKASAALAAAFAATPVFLYLERHGGAVGLGADTALADVPVAMFVAAFAAGAWRRRNGDDDSGRLVMACAAGAALTKQEGAALVLVLAVAGLLADMLARRTAPGRWRTWLAPLAAIVGTVAIWKFLARAMPVETGENYLSAEAIGNMFAQLDRLGPILARLASEHVQFAVWGGLWLLPLLLIGRIVFLRTRGQQLAHEQWALLLLFWWLGATALTVVPYLATGWKGGAYEALMEYSLARLVMHHAPLCALMACEWKPRSAELAD